MKNTFIMYAKYLQDKNKKITAILDKLPRADLEKDAGSYYKSIRGLYEHCAGCGAFFMSLLQGVLPPGSPALSIKPGDAKTVKDASWSDLKAFAAKADSDILDFITKLTDEDLKRELKWFSGDMATIAFALNAMVIHQTHHQGQISQILDEMKIENDFAGIPVEFA